MRGPGFVNGRTRGGRLIRILRLPVTRFVVGIGRYREPQRVAVILSAGPLRAIQIWLWCNQRGESFTGECE